MAGPSADRITEWEGGSLNELVAMLQAAALPVRIEVIAPGTTGSNAGEVHLLAGGLADAFAGSLRRDDAMAALQRLEGARYVIESRLPHPESGSLSEPGPHQGSLKDRPLASLMRYCEEYVLTCRLEVWRGQDRAVISYRRGEIIGTVVGGSEGSELLPEVMAWTEGSYEIILPAPVLPQMPSRGRDGARSERKRHTTLPMATAQDAKPEGQVAPRVDAGVKFLVGGKAATGTAPRPGTAQPAQSAVPSSTSLSNPATLQPFPPPQSPSTPVAATPRPIATTPKTAAVAVAGLLQPEMTARGTPPAPAAPLVPAPPAQTASRPTMQGTSVPLVSPKPAVPTLPKVATPTGHATPLAHQKAASPAVQPGSQAQQKPNPFAIQPAPQAKPAAPLAQVDPKAQQKPSVPAARPIPQALQKPAAPAAPSASQAQQRPNPFAIQPAPQPKSVSTAQPAPQAQPKPAATTAEPASQAQPKPAQVAAASPAAPPAAQPLVPAANLIEKPQPVPAMPPKPAPAASNDLIPASGTFEAKPKHANYLPPNTPPVQIANEPNVVATEQPLTPAVVPNRPPAPRRQRVATSKGMGEHPVRVYVLVGLAIGVGVVLAYGAYWYLPFGHH
jgi:hypothetical protein